MARTLTLSERSLAELNAGESVTLLDPHDENIVVVPPEGGDD